jgi:hypothetical protein
MVLPPKPFVVNERQLVVATVRSILTTKPGKAWRKLVAAMVWPTLRFLLNWRRAPDLCLSKEFSNIFRDFSATTRIGELAQGISYAYWHWERGYVWIADFGPWASKLTPSYVGKKSPDFVMFNPVLNDLAVFEAKGSGSPCHKKAMGVALRQCKVAVKHPAFNRGYGSVLTLDSKNLLGFGTLHIRDPDSAAQPSEELQYYVFRRSYASWFDLTGDDELALWCREEFPEAIGAEQHPKRINKRVNATNSPLTQILVLALGLDPERTFFAIDDVVVEAILSFESFQANRESLLFRIRGRAAELQRFEGVIFPDGTYIIQE